MADASLTRLQQLRERLIDWQIQARLQWATLRDWFEMRFRPETFRQRMIIDTEGPVPRRGQEAQVEAWLATNAQERHLHREFLLAGEPPEQALAQVREPREADARAQDRAERQHPEEEAPARGTPASVERVVPEALRTGSDDGSPVLPDQIANMRNTGWAQEMEGHGGTEASRSLLEQATALRERLEAVQQAREAQGQTRQRDQGLGL
jgi:hypothetical protein